MIVSERYAPVSIGVNSSVVINKNSIGGFLCKTAGTITITNHTGATIYVDTYPVAAGVYYPMPFFLNHNTSIATTAGGASGVLAV